MSNITLSERVLSILSTRERSSEIVGDLLERELKGFALQAAILKVAFRLLVRRIYDFVAAIACCVSVVALYCLYVVPKWKLPHHESWVVWSFCAAGLSLCLATTTGLTVSRYGIQDRLTRSSALIWLIVTVAACVAWLPYSLLGILTVLVAGTVFLLRRARLRRLAYCVLTPALGFAASSGLFYLFSRLTLMPSTGKASVANLGFAAVACILSLAVESAILGRLRPGILDRA